MRKVKAMWYSLSFRARMRFLDYSLAVGVAASVTWLLLEVFSS